MNSDLWLKASRGIVVPSSIPYTSSEYPIATDIVLRIPWFCFHYISDNVSSSVQGQNNIINFTPLKAASKSDKLLSTAILTSSSSCHGPPARIPPGIRHFLCVFLGFNRILRYHIQSQGKTADYCYNRQGKGVMQYG